MNKSKWRKFFKIQSHLPEALPSNTAICNASSPIVKREGRPSLSPGVTYLAPCTVHQSFHHASESCALAAIAAPISTVALTQPLTLRHNPMPLLRRIVFSPVGATPTTTLRMARPLNRQDLTWRASSRILFSPSGDDLARKAPMNIETTSRRDFSSAPPWSSESAPLSTLDREYESSEEQHDQDESDDGGSEYFTCTSQDAESPLPSSSSTDSLIEAIENLEVQQQYSPLVYRLSETELERARESKADDEVLYWSWNLYRSPGGEMVTRHYCKTKEQSERWAAALLNEKMLGFDLEWKIKYHSGARSFKEEVSTIQLASETRIALFHVALHEGSTPEEVLAPSLKRILESTDYLKAGVNVRGDLNRLRKYWNLEPAGYFELSHLYKLVKYSETAPRLVNKRLISLAQQVEEILGMPLAKDDVRTSDWSREIKIDQIDYACSDAYAAVQLFGQLNARRLQLSNVPPLPDFLERDTPIRFTMRTEEGESLEVQSRDNSEAEGEGEGEADGESKILGANANEVEEGAADTSPATDSGERKTRNGEAEPQQQASAEVAACVSSARTWAEEYRRQRTESEQTLRASNSQLVAYRLWHEQQFALTDVAAYMSTRPLQISTVSSYVLECIRLERMPFDKARLDECLSRLPPQIAGRKYSALLKQQQQQQQRK